MFQRSVVRTLVERLAEPLERITAIFGPRQTGKTTAVRQALVAVGEAFKMEHEYVAVDEPDPQGPADPMEMDAATASVHGSAVESGTVDAATRSRRPFGASSAIRMLSAPQRDGNWLVDVWEHSRIQAWEVAASGSIGSPRSRMAASRRGRPQHGFVLVLDEIQKIEGWSEVVKGLWDADRFEGCPMHVVILGSAPLLMQDGLTESLAGRFEPIRVTHWSYSEMSRAFGFNLEQYVFFGGYPGEASRVVADTGDSERWAVYVRESLIEPNIERDILSMVKIRKPALLRRLFEFGVLYSGQILSFDKLLGQLRERGNATTLARYLELLSKAGLLTGLSKHIGRPFSAKASTTKLNVLNTALMAAVSGYTFAEAQADRAFWGRMTESAIGAHLINTASPRTKVRYWREKDLEVDFVLHRGPHTVGIEVKSGSRGKPVVHDGLREFQRRFKSSAVVMIGGKGVPLDEFLSKPADHWFSQTDVTWGS